MTNNWLRLFHLIGFRNIKAKKKYMFLFSRTLILTINIYSVFYVYWVVTPIPTHSLLEKASSFIIPPPVNSKEVALKPVNSFDRKYARLTEAIRNGFRDTFKCEKDGVFGDRSSKCIVFYQCIWSNTPWVKKINNLCPEDTSFNSGLGICDWSHKFVC